MDTNVFNQSVGTFLEQNVWIIIIVFVWSLIWKAWALWRSARQGDKVWFGALMVINTVGILEILYIFYFSRTKPAKHQEK